MSKGISRDGYNIEIISSRKTKEVKVVNLDTGDIHMISSWDDDSDEDD